MFPLTNGPQASVLVGETSQQKLKHKTPINTMNMANLVNKTNKELDFHHVSLKTALFFTDDH